MSAREAVEALVEGSDASIREDDKARGAPGGMNETFEERMEHKPVSAPIAPFPSVLGLHEQVTDEPATLPSPPPPP